jgi:hypothetical protein
LKKQNSGYITAALMTPDLINQVTAGLLILTLASVLLIGFLLTLFAVSYVKRARAMVPLVPFRRRGFENLLKCHGTVIERPARWFAVASSNVKAVQAVLALQNPTPCSWGEGLLNSGEHKLFISPPIRGWILIMGQAVPDPSEDVDECFRFLVKLSKAFGRAQFFSANPALDHHAWARAEAGRVERGYAWAGETLWNQGALTLAEKELAVRCFEYAEGPDFLDITSALTPIPNSEKVNVLAARWSVDPYSIGSHLHSSDVGIAGQLDRSFKL